MNRSLNHLLLISAIIPLLFFEVQSQISWQRHLDNPVVTSDFYYNTLSPAVLVNTKDCGYQMWFTSFGGGPFRINYAVSSNSIDWSVYSKNPVLLPGPASWETVGVCHADVIYDNEEYKMYYTGLDAGGGASIGLATSTDGIRWKRYLNNPILTKSPGTWEGVHVSWPKVYFDGQTYFMLYVGYNGSISQTGLATSANGVQWTKHQSNPVLTPGTPGTWDDGGALLSALAVHQGTFYMMYEGRYSPNALGLATSVDGVTWAKYSGNPVLLTGSGWESSQLFRGSLLIRNDRFDYWYSGKGFGGWQIGYATSPIAVFADPLVNTRKPESFFLDESYPNPFNPKARIGLTPRSRTVS